MMVKNYKKTYVYEFINNLTGILNKHGYSINNNKQFRNTIASFIYKNSNNYDLSDYSEEDGSY